MARYAKQVEPQRMSHSEIERLCDDVAAMDAEFNQTGSQQSPASRMVRACRQLLGEVASLRSPAQVTLKEGEVVVDPEGMRRIRADHLARVTSKPREDVAIGLRLLSDEQLADLARKCGSES